MHVDPYVIQVQTQLVAAAALGDEHTRHTAEALVEAAEPAMRLAVLTAVTAAADEITAALLDAPGAPAIAIRVDGDELRVDVRATEAAPEDTPLAATEDADVNARISVRLSEALKSDIETAARAEGVSVNTWLVRTAARALTRRGAARDRERGGHEIAGWING